MEQHNNRTTSIYRPESYPSTSVLSPAHLVATKCLNHVLLGTVALSEHFSTKCNYTHSSIHPFIPIQLVSHPASRPVPMSTAFDSLQCSRQDQRTRSLADPSNVLQAMSPWAMYRETGQGIGGQASLWSLESCQWIGDRECKIM